MSLEEFEEAVRDLIDRISNHLQSANLLASQASLQTQTEILAIGKLMQDLSLLIEDYIAQQKPDQDSSEQPGQDSLNG
jgi:phytoene/squalene synthetase